MELTYFDKNLGQLTTVEMSDQHPFYLKINNNRLEGSPHVREGISDQPFEVTYKFCPQVDWDRIRPTGNIIVEDISSSAGKCHIGTALDWDSKLILTFQNENK